MCDDAAVLISIQSIHTCQFAWWKVTALTRCQGDNHALFSGCWAGIWQRKESIKDEDVSRTVHGALVACVQFWACVCSGGNGGESEGRGRDQALSVLYSKTTAYHSVEGEDINYRIYAQLCQVCKTSSKCNFTICFSLLNFIFHSPPESIPEKFLAVSSEGMLPGIPVSCWTGTRGALMMLPRWTHTHT